jgi:putative ABC transport system permease protein
MHGLSRLRYLWRNLLHRGRVDRDLDDELTAAFEAAVDERIHAGLDPVEARRLTNLELGRKDSIVTQVRQTRAGSGVDSVRHDVTFGLRLLRRQPLFTATAVLSLGLGIGASTTIFSLVNALLLRDVHVSDPASLVELWRTTPTGGAGTAFSYPAYEWLRDENGVFTGVLALSKNTVNGAAGAAATPAMGRLVSGNFFDVLGVGASVGRTFTPRDDRRDDPSAAAVAVISHRLWRRGFGESPDAIGQIVRVGAVPFTVVGVTTAAFDDLIVGRSADFYIPMRSEPLIRSNSLLRSAPSNWLGIVGRLKPGTTPDAARAGLEPAWGRFLADLVVDAPDADARRRALGQRVYIESARNGISDIRRDISRPILLLMGAVTLVLLIACANVVNLLLAGGVARRREIALRLAIGASRRRVIRQLLTEAFLLGAAGALCGLALAAVAAPVVLSFISQGGRPLAVDVAPDRVILLFTISIAIASSLVAGVLPAIRTARTDITPSFEGDTRTLLVTRGATRWGNALIAAQVALSVVLVAGASLLVTTLRNIQGFDPGFAAERVVLVTMDPARAGYKDDRLVQYYRDVLDGVRAMPGVVTASLSRITPISGAGIDLPIAIEGRPPERDVMVYVNRVSEGFFATMTIPVLVGRDFTPADAAHRDTVIVNDAFARKYFPNTSPIGRRLTLASGPPTEIVGVVANSKYLTLREGDVPTAYLYVGDAEPVSMTLSVKTATDPLGAAAAIRERVQSVAPTVPVSAPRPLSSQVERSLASERLIARLLSAFAIVALVLASVGLYGVLGYAVARRTAEIGLRLALGATRREILRSVLRQSLVVVGAGLAIGLPAMILLSRPLRGLLYGVAPYDPRILAGAIVCLALVALAAAAVPALRASRIDPLVALRHE